jgi:hypothetical protein
LLTYCRCFALCKSTMTKHETRLQRIKIFIGIIALAGMFEIIYLLTIIANK